MLALLISLLITLEPVTTPQEIAGGLMGRTELAENHGMLFVFPDFKKRSFWMEGCYIDMSIAFLDEDGIIQEIYEMKAYPEKIFDQAFFYRHAVHSKKSVRYALEMGSLWFEEHDVVLGDRLVWKKGSTQALLMRALQEVPSSSARDQ